jgi:branched-chain amino acid transport system ATP-binding protein
MLAIARAIMARPKLIILDEPSLGPGPILMKTIFQLMTTLNEQKAMIVPVEQHVHQALKKAHHAYVPKTGNGC